MLGAAGVGVQRKLIESAASDDVCNSVTSSECASYCKQDVNALWDMYASIMCSLNTPEQREHLWTMISILGGRDGAIACLKYVQ